jgi:pilus assembly protein CpaF
MRSVFLHALRELDGRLKPEDRAAANEETKEQFACSICYLLIEPLLANHLRENMRHDLTSFHVPMEVDKYVEEGTAYCHSFGIAHVPVHQLRLLASGLVRMRKLELMDREVGEKIRKRLESNESETDLSRQLKETSRAYLEVALEFGERLTAHEIRRRSEDICHASTSGIKSLKDDPLFQHYVSSVTWKDVERLFDKPLSFRFRRELEAWIDDVEQTMIVYREEDFKRRLLDVVDKYATEEEKESLRRTYVRNVTHLQEFVRRMIELSKVVRIGAVLGQERSLPQITRRVVELSRAERFRVSHHDLRQLIQRIHDNLNGYDILQPLIDSQDITEIMVNSYREIYIERNGEIFRYPLEFTTPRMLELRILTIAGRLNRQVNERSPIVDSRLEDGSRVNIVVPPVSLDGHAMTIRKFPKKTYELIPDLVNRFKALPRDVAEFLGWCVRARYNIFIGGGTGSGKTTFLNALSQYIPADERIITIEDAAELQILSVKNIVRLETRPSRSSELESIEIRDLIRAALRMRPNRIVVGEVRGKEALDMLQAMNTGHDGSLSTGHANSTRDMISRLETMVLSGGAELPIPVIRKQIASAIDLFVHLARLRDRSRKVIEIYEVDGMDEKGEIVLNPLFLFQEEFSPDADPRKVNGRLKCVGSLKHREKWFQAGLSQELLDKYFRREE